ncbi:unnamed protein product, partial [Owenia fusiformis]
RVKSLNEGSFIMFGLNVKVDAGEQCQWNVGKSVRYHSNDGGVFNGGSGKRTYRSYDIGDTVAVYLEKIDAYQSLVNFFHNKQLVFREWAHIPISQLHATIGLSVGGIGELQVTWPKEDVQLENDVANIDSLRHWLTSPEVEVKEGDLTVRLAAFDDTRLGFSAQAPRPFNPTWTYFEVEVILMVDTAAGPAVGLSPPVFDKFKYPGWTPDTIGYHGDNGKVLRDDQAIWPYNDANLSNEMRCRQGDRMGCGVL